MRSFKMSVIQDDFLFKEIKNALLNQIKAALNTLEYAIKMCPDSEWQSKHGDAPYSQVVFHTLFYADFYLGNDSIPFKDQTFHKENSDIFADYEEMENREPVKIYKKSFCIDYLSFCLLKTDRMVEAETLETITGESGISFRKCSRLELYIYAERHIQHHAAQLGLRIQQITGEKLKWYSGH